MLLVIFRTWNSKFDFVGLVTLMAVFILMMQGLGTEDVASVLDWIFSIIFPTYCLGSGILIIPSMLLVIFRTWNSNFPKQNMFVCVHYSFLD
jgi:hypothetical protein